MEESNASDARERQEGAADDGLRQPPDHEAAEIERLRRKLRDSRAREERAAAEAAEARERLSQLSAASRSFANAMRVRAVERERFKRRLAAQYAVGRVLAEAVDLDAAAPDIFAILAEELGWNLGVLWKLDEGSKVLRYAGGWRVASEAPLGVEEASPCRTFARGDGLLGRVWARGEPARVQDVPGDSSLREEVVVAEDLRTALAFPIRHKVRAFGVFELFSRVGAPPDEDLARTVALVGNQIGQFLERRRAEAERDRLRERESAARAELEERERISRELHDRVAHSMGVVQQSLQLYEFLQENDPPRAAAKLALAKQTTKAALESTRDLSTELRRSEAEEGLVPALRDLVEVAVPPGMRAELRTSGDESRLPPGVRSHLFSVLREGVRNAVRHSGANRLLVEFRVTADAATGSVEDDGRGLREPSGDGDDGGKGATGGGLRSMKERARLMGGHLRFLPNPGGGTRVEVTVPLGGRG